PGGRPHSRLPRVPVVVVDGAVAGHGDPAARLRPAPRVGRGPLESRGRAGTRATRSSASPPQGVSAQRDDLLVVLAALPPLFLFVVSERQIAGAAGFPLD